jgi:hypothetical protein
VTSSLEVRRRDQIAALSAHLQYEGAARSYRSLATELRGRRFTAIADQLDAAADIAAKAARAEIDYQEGTAPMSPDGR